MIVLLPLETGGKRNESVPRGEEKGGGPELHLLSVFLPEATRGGGGENRDSEGRGWGLRMFACVVGMIHSLVGGGEAKFKPIDYPR